MVQDYYQSFFENGQVARWLVDVHCLQERCEQIRSGYPVGSREYLDELTKLSGQGGGLIENLAVNRALLNFFHVRNPDEFLTASLEVFSSQGCSFYSELISQLVQGRSNGKFRMGLGYRGMWHKYVQIYVDVLPGKSGTAAVFTFIDITEDRLKNKQLHESMEKYRLLITAANDAIIICEDESGKIEEINPRALTLFNRQESECIGINHTLLFPEDERERYLEFYTKRLTKGHKGDVFSAYVERKEGERIPVEINLAGTVIGERGVVQISFHDVRNRRKLEERRRLLATAVDQAAESVIITDLEGNIEYVNPAFEKTSGYTFAEAVGRTPAFLKSKETSKLEMNLLWKEISRGKVWQGTLSNRKKDGTLYREQATVTPVRDSLGTVNHYVMVKRDITQQTALEQQMRQSQKMQAIGTLAGGVAHDFNNILTAIMGYAELTQAMCEKNTIIYDNLSEVIKGAERAGKLIDQILQFSRKSEKSTSSLQIDLIVKEVLKLLRASLQANIEIVSDLESGSFVKADPTQMHQVIMNLCTNAYQALENTGGQIKVSLSTESLTLRQGVEIGNLSQGEYICITVHDNGVGIPKEYLPRIFEPYFTTRDQNEGTGLGLSVVHGIINDHGGAVSVDSAVGKGTIFRLYLPKAEYQEEEAKADDIYSGFGGGRILVVDDEPNIVNFQAQVLEHFGYEVVSCTTSADAVDLFTKEDGDFNLVITDMGMPEMTGLELLDELKRIEPEVKVLLCTGYSKQVTEESALEKGLAGYLAKPFNAHQLLNEVTRIVCNDEGEVV